MCCGFIRPYARAQNNPGESDTPSGRFAAPARFEPVPGPAGHFSPSASPGEGSGFRLKEQTKQPKKPAMKLAGFFLMMGSELMDNQCKENPDV
jgi:hypothetical protein